MKKYLALILLLVFILTAHPTLAFWGWKKGLKVGFDFEKATEKVELMFERWARILGINVEKIKEYWAEGLNPKEIMEKEGIDENKVKENIKGWKTEQLKEFLQRLVDKGIITREQMEKRLKIEQQRLEDCSKCKFLPGIGKRNWKW